MLDELIGRLLLKRWLDPLADSADPLTAVQRAFRRYVEDDIASGMWLQGCPLNNLAQEMNPLDDGFRSRTLAVFKTWHDAYAAAIKRAKSDRIVKQGVRPADAAHAPRCFSRATPSRSSNRSM